jgi:hypothetical protein
MKKPPEITPLYIFDLDGTLAKTEHRHHFISGKKKDWPAFFAACPDDSPNYPILCVMATLIKSGGEVWIWSGRSDVVERETEAWLKLHAPDWWVGHGKLKMRPAGDHQTDEKLKGGWFDELKPMDRIRLVAIFDDCDRVVSMWREKGVTCLQVAPGNF